MKWLLSFCKILSYEACYNARLQVWQHCWWWINWRQKYNFKSLGALARWNDNWEFWRLLQDSLFLAVLLQNANVKSMCMRKIILDHDMFTNSIFEIKNIFFLELENVRLLNQPVLFHGWLSSRWRWRVVLDAKVNQILWRQKSSHFSSGIPYQKPTELDSVIVKSGES